MCGRFFIGQPPEVYRTSYGYPEQPNFPGRFNVAPTQPVPVVLRESGERHLRLMRWGLWPAWLKDPSDFPVLFNARIETAAEKPAFRGPMRHHRCVFLADGFYEWRREGSGKAAVRTPFAVRRADGAPMALAGLWQPWMGADGSEVDTAAIVTCSANGTLSAIHERMPAILAPEAVEAWLDAAVDAPEAARLCRPCPDDWLRLDPVSDRVNSVRNDDAGLPEPAAPARPAAASHRSAPVRGAEVQGELF
ncbi:SOS response-associated peptidase [Methylobacterium sp. B4]|uniref:SOS response-associated peptidase n=1 Tax=Methylobacterium sp. B4 TaxID=1938755 RepID=UPI000D76DE36|nr:SOS response-associated peptidase [Methylobacterium sp. B4]PXW59943.1 putative SOS response-associated peptidase YedK [Methylobacterium sp. B4]